MFDNNYWYYTLSTIAQTLAAILGLAAVFVTLRSQNIIKVLEEYKKGAYLVVKLKEEHIDKPPKILKIYQRSASGLFKELQEIEKNYKDKYDINPGMKSGIAALARKFEPDINFNNISFLNDSANNLFIYVDRRREIINSVKWPGVFTAGTIIYTILLLSFTNVVANFHYLKFKFFVLAVVCSIIIFILIIIFSWKLLKDASEKI
jgi:hypothetical protein